MCIVCKENNGKQRKQDKWQCYSCIKPFKIDRHAQLIIHWINLLAYEIKSSGTYTYSLTYKMFAVRGGKGGGGGSKMDDEDAKWEVTHLYWYQSLKNRYGRNISLKNKKMWYKIGWCQFAPNAYITFLCNRIEIWFVKKAT